MNWTVKEKGAEEIAEVMDGNNKHPVHISSNLSESTGPFSLHSGIHDKDDTSQSHLSSNLPERPM